MFDIYTPKSYIIEKQRKTPDGKEEKDMMKMKVGNWYKFKEQGETKTHIGQYVGKEDGFECCVCGKGCKARCFNVWYDEEGGYETWGYGAEHMPDVLEEVGGMEDVILDK
jgi:hypothetical protein